MKTIKNYIDLIDLKYKKARKKRLSRMSIEWGKWSAKMNRDIRQRQKKEPMLADVFVYWQIKSQLLELYYVSRFFKRGKKAELRKAAKECKKRLFREKFKIFSKVF